jgi:hypothetical protein
MMSAISEQPFEFLKGSNREGRRALRHDGQKKK